MVERAQQAIRGLAADQDYLARYGLSAAEYELALPTAIESLRGSMSAGNADRRRFLASIFDHLLEQGLLEGVTTPKYGADTVYRLAVPNLGPVAVIQKGCPDGAHSSVRWAVPDWAQETYLWWLCPSTKSHPGEHVAKGLNRLRQRFFSDPLDFVDGVIFHDELCGGPLRPCPKQSRAVAIAGRLTPPPCIYVLPQAHDGDDADEWNWDGARQLAFPDVLLAAFAIPPTEAGAYTGYVGFQRRRNGAPRSTVTARFGVGRSTTHRTRT